MNTNLQPLKGFRDFLPEETFQRQWLKNQLIKIFESWGFESIETPTLEPLSMFEGQIGQDEKLFYSFQDNGKRQVLLRYDQTVPSARLIGRFSNELIFPFRRYQIQPVFRAEKPQAGRYREFLQCDADIYGVKSAYADAEMIALSLDIYRQLGFSQAIAYINDRSLLANFPPQIIQALDKLDKIGQSEVINLIISQGFSQDQANEYFNQITNLQPNQTVQTILDYLKSYGFDSTWYKFEPTIARAFSYSQGPIWEIKLPDYANGTVLGGERYDKLIQTITNQSISGTGFGLGFDRTLQAAIANNLVPAYQPITQVIIIPTDPYVLSYAQQITTQCRKLNLKVELIPDPQEKISKHLKYASRRKLPYAIIIGEQEMQTQTISLKNLNTGDQKTLSFNDLSQILQ